MLDSLVAALTLILVTVLAGAGSPGGKQAAGGGMMRPPRPFFRSCCFLFLVCALFCGKANAETMEIEGASEANVDLYVNPEDPSTTRALGAIRFFGNDSSLQKGAYFLIESSIEDPNPASKSAALKFSTQVAGEMKSVAEMGTNGFQIPSATSETAVFKVSRTGDVWSSGTLTAGGDSGLGGVHKINGCLQIRNEQGVPVSDGECNLIFNFNNKNGGFGIGCEADLSVESHKYIDLWHTGPYCDGYTWISNSTRETKLNITAVSSQHAWDLLDRITPVDYNYKKFNPRHNWWMDPSGDYVSTQTQTALQRNPSDAVARGYKKDQHRMLDEPLNKRTRGFIVEDMPAELTYPGGLSALEIAANNTAVLKEAKRRILALEEKFGVSSSADGKTSGSAARVLAMKAPSADAKDAAAIGALKAELARLDDQQLDILARLKVAEKQDLVGNLPPIEIPFEKAWELADEMTTITARKMVTLFRVNWKTTKVEPFQAMRSVSELMPTGRKVKQLKPDVVFDSKSGKCYRRRQVEDIASSRKKMEAPIEVQAPQKEPMKALSLLLPPADREKHISLGSN